uniref:Uncharacterized protein n=1 Tax=Opuntia streptacantha TaxID=393608 RepID=A0A7C8ZXI5_OPUST
MIWVIGRLGLTQHSTVAVLPVCRVPTDENEKPRRWKGALPELVTVTALTEGRRQSCKEPEPTSQGDLKEEPSSRAVGSDFRTARKVAGEGDRSERGVTRVCGVGLRQTSRAGKRAKS